MASGKLRIRYIFLLGTTEPTQGAIEFLDSFKDFVEEIRIVSQKGHQLAPGELRPSIVLFQNQRTAFTHDRGDNSVLTEADHWIFPGDYERLRKQYGAVELASEVYFTKPVQR